MEQNLEIENKLDKFIIDKPKEIINSLIKEDVSRELINFVDKQMESCKNYNDAPIKYIKTIGYHKSNLTTTPTVNSKVLYEIFPKKFLYTFKKKGIIHINRNDKDFLRSIADFAINYEDSKLQNKNISEKEHQNITLEVLKGIGGYKDIEFYNDVTKKKIFLEFTICA
ncbi:MAG: hypothetical protein ACXW1A_03555 [Nitrososphaeraceae archaeon]